MEERKIRSQNTIKFVSTIVFLAVLLPTSFAQNPWKFIVTCDSRGYSNGINEIILSELVHEITSQGVDFLLFPGDLVSGYIATGPSEFESQLRTWVEIMKPVYDAGIPVYVCRGNHEIGDVWGVYSYPGIDPNDNYTTRWLNVFGSDFHPELKLPDNGPVDEKYMTYSVTHKNAFIISLDQYAGIKHEAVHKINQKWLDAQLAANTKPHIFVAGHEPAFRALHSDCLDNRPSERNALWASLKKTGGRTYFCGHDHFYDHARVDDGDGYPDNDIHQYLIGTAGAPPYTWIPPYIGDNNDYTIEQWHHAQGYGYVLVKIDDLDVTLTWMERHTNNLNIPGIYEPNDIWSYTVTPKLIVLSPNGNENLVASGLHTITWKTLGEAQIDYVSIEYSADNGQSWEEIGPWWNTGSYKWDPIPVVDSNQCLVRISNPNDFAISDTSDETFTIFQCLKQLKTDLNGDCYVDFLDFAILASDWLKCGNPFDAPCD
jgi:hypothetical protein